MQHDMDYDRAWDKVSQQFWRRRIRELIIHAALFLIVQLLMLFEVVGRGTIFYTYNEPYLFLKHMGIDQLPYFTVNWAVIFIIHGIVLMGMALGERIFRYSVERELLRDFARSNQMDEKRKMRPAYPAYNELSNHESGFESMDEADEAAYRQSAHSPR
jgi:hypothetical protein